MADNIVHALEKQLGYPPLEKVDPNTQETTSEQYGGPHKLKLGQAAIPAVLEGLSKYYNSKTPLRQIYQPATGNSWLEAIFGSRKEAAVQRVAEYADTDANTAASEMERVAVAAVQLISNKYPDATSQQEVSEYLGGQRSHILTRLPASMQFGELLGDDTIDDRTNKMEGPISSLMHKIEDSFSGSTPKEKKD